MIRRREGYDKTTFLSSLARISTHQDPDEEEYCLVHWDCKNRYNYIDIDVATKMGLNTRKKTANVLIQFADIEFEVEAEIQRIEDHLADIKLGKEFMTTQRAQFDIERKTASLAVGPEERIVRIPIFEKCGLIDYDAELQRTKGIQRNEKRLIKSTAEEKTYTLPKDSDPLRTVAVNAEGNRFYCRMEGCKAQNLDATNFSHHWNTRTITEFTCTRRKPHGLESLPYSRPRRQQILESAGRNIADIIRRTEYLLTRDHEQRVK